MLSFLRALQSLHARSQTHHPGRYHPGDHSLLLPGDHRQAIRHVSENSNTHFNHYTVINRYRHIHRYSNFLHDLVPNPDQHPNQYTHRPTFNYPNINLYFNFHLHAHPYIDPYSDSQPNPLPTTDLGLYRYTNTN